MREGLQTQDRDSVSLHGPEAGGIRGRVEGHDDRGSPAQLVSEDVNPKSQAPRPKASQIPTRDFNVGIWVLGFGISR